MTGAAAAKRSNTTAFGRFFRALLERGVYWPPSQFEAAFVSSAHSPDDVAETIAAAARALEEIGTKEKYTNVAKAKRK